MRLSNRIVIGITGSWWWIAKHFLDPTHKDPKHACTKLLEYYMKNRADFFFLQVFRSLRFHDPELEWNESSVWGLLILQARSWCFKRSHIELPMLSTWSAQASPCSRLTTIDHARISGFSCLGFLVTPTQIHNIIRARSPWAASRRWCWPTRRRSHTASV